MPVEIFTQAAFEDALPKHKVTKEPLCQLIGLVEGEFEYRLPIDKAVSITIRSSINSSGKSAASGQDSIRAWLVDNTGTPLGNKLQSWITRTSGWDLRLVHMLRKLWNLRAQAGNCSHCGKPKHIYKVKKAGLNKGRMFATCRNCEHDKEYKGFVWLD